MDRDGLAASELSDAFVGLALDADAIRRQPSAPATLVRIVSTYGCSFGRSAMTTTSTLPTTNPRLPDDPGRAAQQIEAGSAGPCRIGVREVTSNVPHRSGAKHRVGQRMTDGVGVGMAEETTVERNCHTAENQGAPVDHSMEIVADTDSHAIRGLLDGAPRAGSDGLGEQNILGRRDLDVQRLTLDEADFMAGTFDERRLIGGFFHGEERITQDGVAKRLGGLREENRFTR